MPNSERLERRVALDDATRSRLQFATPNQSLLRLQRALVKDRVSNFATKRFGENFRIKPRLRRPNRVELRLNRLAPKVTLANPLPFFHRVEVREKFADRSRADRLHFRRKFFNLAFNDAFVVFVAAFFLRALTFRAGNFLIAQKSATNGKVQERPTDGGKAQLLVERPGPQRIKEGLRLNSRRAEEIRVEKLAVETVQIVLAQFRRRRFPLRQEPGVLQDVKKFDDSPPRPPKSASNLPRSSTNGVSRLVLSFLDAVRSRFKDANAEPKRFVRKVAVERRDRPTDRRNAQVEPQDVRRLTVDAPNIRFLRNIPYFRFIRHFLFFSLNR